MIDHIYIKNFKAYEKETIVLKKNNLIVGENDAGKSSILEALEIFFNEDKIPNTKFVRNSNNDVEIGVFVSGKMYIKKYTGKTKKAENKMGDFSEISHIRYIYLKANSNDPLKLIQDLAVAKTLNVLSDETKQELLSKMTESMDLVINDIDPSMVVIDRGTTTIAYENNLKLDAAIKFNVTSNGIPIEARGSGFQKNMVYALLTGRSYDNVILAVDEIENSFSVNNGLNLIRIVNATFYQTLITTHSIQIVGAANTMNLVPRYSSTYDTLSKLLNALDRTQNEVFILVEGKYDLPWIEKAIELIGDTSKIYRVISAGGKDNIDHIYDSLLATGRKLVKIKDGDVGAEEQKINLDMIELYVPLDALNDILDLDLDKVPTNKEDFFAATVIEGVRNEDSVKNLLSNKAIDFLDISNPLIEEVKELINTQLND